MSLGGFTTLPGWLNACCRVDVRHPLDEVRASDRSVPFPCCVIYGRLCQKTFDLCVFDFRVTAPCCRDLEVSDRWSKSLLTQTIVSHVTRALESFIRAKNH